MTLAFAQVASVPKVLNDLDFLSDWNFFLECGWQIRLEYMSRRFWNLSPLECESSKKGNQMLSTVQCAWSKLLIP